MFGKPLCIVLLLICLLGTLYKADIENHDWYDEQYHKLETEDVGSDLCKKEVPPPPNETVLMARIVAHRLFPERVKEYGVALRQKEFKNEYITMEIHQNVSEPIKASMSASGK